MLDRIKRWLGMDKPSQYVQHYFEASNIRASVYMSVIIIALEVWMIINALSYFFEDERTRSTRWIVSHLIAYVILFAAAAISLYNADRYFKKKASAPEKRNTIILSSFSTICIIFGMYISYNDYAKGEQVLTFIAMMLFAFCLMVWKPHISIILTSISFIIFYVIMYHLDKPSFATKVNYFVLWVAVVVTSISNYQQKVIEAAKDEEVDSASEHLRKAAIIDEITSVANISFFRQRSVEILNDPEVDPQSKIFLFLDVENFKSFNEKYGYESGNAFLGKLALDMTEIFYNGLVARQGDDHFVILTDKDGVSNDLAKLRAQIYGYQLETQIGLKAGGYVPKDKDTDPNIACDHARYACNSIKKRYDQDYREYDKDLDDEFKMKQYIVNNIDVALDRGDIKVYYQPVVWAKDRKLCGYEALAKWKDPEYGFIPPGLFIPILEEYRQVHKLDMIVIETVCKDLRMQFNKGNPTVPVSLNFSRLDFELMDAVEVLETCAKKYNIPRDYIHVEVTESALSEYLETLQVDLQRMRNYGYPLWLDDFGSGYSSLNVLKDFDFDVMKIDMKFLSTFDDNPQKSKAVLKNIVKMASDLGMSTLTEGVETFEQAEYLKKIGCDRLQGFLFGKAMPLKDIMFKITAGSISVSEEFMNH
ncbi:MAG: EAL domain-containing protein [Clostridiales bacterium]|nr:EAL domain-containing protein [Clostridiales bacterium]